MQQPRGYQLARGFSRSLEIEYFQMMYTMPSQCEKSLDIPRLSEAYFRFIHRQTISRYLSIQLLLTAGPPLTCFSLTVKNFPSTIEINLLPYVGVPYHFCRHLVCLRYQRN